MECSGKVGFHVNQEIRVQAGDGVDRLMKIRQEDSKGGTRYTLRSLKRFMGEAGIISGDNYLLGYQKRVAKLFISRA